MTPIQDFINAIEQVCREHGLTIGHEDQHGAFLIRQFSEADIEWLRDAVEDLR